jgi:hypothetical protein
MIGSMLLFWKYLDNKSAVFTPNIATFTMQIVDRNIGFQEKSQFCSQKIAENCDRNIYVCIGSYVHTYICI